MELIYCCVESGNIQLTNVFISKMKINLRQNTTKQITEPVCVC